MELFVKILSCLSLLFCCVKAATNHLKTVELALTSNFGNTIGDSYGVNLTIGTPGQPQMIALDTGSSDTIFVASNASICEKDGCNGGTFNSSKSTTFKMAKPGALDSGYFDGTRMRGDLITDVAHLDNHVITNFPIELAKEGRLPFAPRVGFLGLGYSRKMAHLRHRNGVKSFPGFVDTLIQAGAISSRLYSIYLNTLDLGGSSQSSGQFVKRNPSRSGPETQKVKVKGRISASVVPGLSTVASTASYATSTESRSSATGIAELFGASSDPRSIAPMRRSESTAAAMIVPRTIGFWYLGAFLVVLLVEILK
ncbi:hypothetical protein QM012_000570 [Aureobasidium pullulans]|uniref:Peptidase A1 domain-containing protein n=1 Tax=Aureobasidium pullulans TaxID=5580 RepID=A0ABR0TWH6_AURPU